MAEPHFTVEETPASKRTRENVEKLAQVSAPALRRAFRQIMARQLGETVGAFRKQATPGGGDWPENHPNYVRFKATVLGQSPVMAGVINGQLRQSIAMEMNEANLEGSVGSSDKNAQSFHSGGPVPEWLIFKRDDGWHRVWMGRGTSAPPRRFIPTVGYASRLAERVTSAALRKAIVDTGLDVKGPRGELTPGAET